MAPFPPHSISRSAISLGIWLCVLFFIPHITHAQTRTLSRQYVFEDISSRKVNAMLEDCHGFLWAGSNGLYKYDGHELKRYRPLKADSTQADLGTVYALEEDDCNRFWIGSSKGVFRYDKRTDKVEQVFSIRPSPEFHNGTIFSLLKDSKGRLWIGDNRGDIYVFEDPEGGSPQQVQGMEQTKNFQEPTGVRSIVEDKDGHIFAASNKGLYLIQNDLDPIAYVPKELLDQKEVFQVRDLAVGQGDSLWLATGYGVWLFRSGTRRFEKPDIPGLNDKSIRKLFFTDAGMRWIGTSRNGLYLLENGKLIHFPSQGGNSFGLNNPEIVDICLDRFNNIWVASWTNLHRVNLKNPPFPFYQHTPGINERDNFTFRVMQDSLGGFWFRYLQLGLGYAADLDKEVEILLHPRSNSANEEIKNFCLDADGNVWVITLTQGLYKFEKGKKEPQLIDLGDSMKIANALTILADQRNPQYIWFSSQLGLCRVNRHTLQHRWFHPTKDIPEADSNIVGNFAQAGNGKFLCRARSKGAVFYAFFDPESGVFSTQKDIKEHPGALPFSQVNHMVSVSENEIWVGHAGGILVVDTEKETYVELNKEHGFPLKSVQSITPDLDGNIWFSGDHQICKYDGQNSQCLDAGSGIKSFIYWSAALGRDGRLTFGGANGMLSFYPHEVDFSRDTTYTNVYLSGVKLFNKPRNLGKGLELVNEITLDYAENVLALEFSAPYFGHEGPIQYQYQLVGFDKEPVDANSGERTAIYTNLSPRTYTFRVTAKIPGAEGIANFKELEIAIRVRPPWYRTWWAYSLFAAVIVGFLFFLRKYEIRQQLARSEARHFKALDQAKTQLYSNITHEFRTPLTIILGMADQMKEDPKNWFNEGIQLIRRNGKHLLQLVNQLLDLAKLESGHVTLNLVNGDIIPYLHYLTQSFHSYADSKDIRLHFSSDFKKLEMDHDPERLQQILSNLLSNAIKFTPEGGDVYVDVRAPNHGGQIMVLQVRDNGPGIPVEHLPHIFDRFYQVDPTATRKTEGTGIGLALAKELVKLMGGTIEVESDTESNREDKGTKFTIRLPIRQETPAILERQELVELESVEVWDKISAPASIHLDLQESDRPLLLLIEDNADVITYLSSFLSREYTLTMATNGQQGIDKAFDLIPDLVICDVMMPEKDGFEVCAELKSDERTSHVPIILLTAKADETSRLEGLALGADAYLPKPFKQQELLVRIEKLIELRKRLQEHYQGAGNLKKVVDHPNPSTEDRFLKKVLHLLEENLSDEHFGIPQLGKAVGLERTQLFRKIKALTGKSTSAFIRSVRLARAKELLEKKDLNVSEVAYRVGFNNPSYFSRMFKEEFGVSPSEVE